MKLLYPLALSVILLLSPDGKQCINAVNIRSTTTWDDEEYVNDKMVADK